MSKNKKHTFTKEEIAFLTVYNLNKRIAHANFQASDLMMKIYVKETVAPRLGLDLTKVNLNFDVDLNEIQVLPKEDNSAATTPDSEGNTPA